MNNPWDPSTTEIKEWAFNKKAVEPVQDWDLALSWKREEDLYLDLASNEKCPKRQYFLKILYLIIGDAVRTDYKYLEKPIIEGFIKKGEKYKHSDIQLWVERSKYLIKNPSSFHYGMWCDGELAKNRS